MSIACTRCGNDNLASYCSYIRKWVSGLDNKAYKDDELSKAWAYAIEGPKE